MRACRATTMRCRCCHYRHCPSSTAVVLTGTSSSSCLTALLFACCSAHDTSQHLPPSTTTTMSDEATTMPRVDGAAQPSSTAHEQVTGHVPNTTASSTTECHDASATSQPSFSSHDAEHSNTRSSGKYHPLCSYHTTAVTAMQEHAPWLGYRAGSATHRMPSPWARTASRLQPLPSTRLLQRHRASPRTLVAEAATSLPSSHSLRDTSVTHNTAEGEERGGEGGDTYAAPTTTAATTMKGGVGLHMSATSSARTTPTTLPPPTQQQKEREGEVMARRPKVRTRFSFRANFEQEDDAETLSARYNETNVVPNNTPKPLLPMWASSLTSPALGKVRLVRANWISQDILGNAPHSAVRAFLASLTCALPATCPLRTQLQHTVTLAPRRSSCRGLYAKRPLRRGEVILSIPLIATMKDMSKDAQQQHHNSKEQDASMEAATCHAAVEAEEQTTIASHASDMTPSATSTVSANEDASTPLLFALNAETLLRYSHAARRRCVPPYDTIASLVHGQRHSASEPIVHARFMEQIYLACLLACEKAAGTASSLHAYFTLLQSCPYMFDNDHIRELHRDVLEPAALLEYSDHQRRFLHYLRVIHTHWCQQYERTLQHNPTNSENATSVSRDMTSEGTESYASAVEPLASLVSAAETRHGKGSGDEAHTGSNNDAEDDVHGGQRSSCVTDLTTTTTASSAALAREMAKEQTQSVPAFLLLLSQSATTSDMTKQSSSSPRDTNVVTQRSANSSYTTAGQQEDEAYTRSASSSHVTQTSATMTSLSSALPPPSLAELEWCLRVVLSRQWMLPRIREGNSHTATHAIREDSTEDDNDKLDAFARAVMRLKRLFYAKVLRVLDDDDQREDSNDSVCEGDGCKVTHSEAVSDGAAHAVSGDKRTRRAPIATLVPLLDMLQHPPSGVANTRFSVELMPLSSSADVTQSTQSCSTECNAHANDSTPPSHTAHTDKNTTAATVADKRTSAARDKTDEVVVPHVVLRATEDIDVDEELTLLFSRCYSVAYTLYRYGCLPLRHRADDMRELHMQQQQQRWQRGHNVHYSSSHHRHQLTASLSQPQGN